MKFGGFNSFHYLCSEKWVRDEPTVAVAKRGKQWMGDDGLFAKRAGGCLHHSRTMFAYPSPF